MTTSQSLAALPVPEERVDGVSKYRLDATDNKPNKVMGLQYYRSWNTTDLCGEPSSTRYHTSHVATRLLTNCDTGRYHVQHIKSKYPVPGTAVSEDLSHLKKQADDMKRFEDGIAHEARKMKNRIKLKSDTAAFKTRLDFAAGVGGQIAVSEKVCNETYDLLRPPKATGRYWIMRFLSQTTTLLTPFFSSGDTQKQMAFFYKNVKNGNTNYIAYAMASGVLPNPALGSFEPKTRMS